MKIHCFLTSCISSRHGCDGGAEQVWKLVIKPHFSLVFSHIFFKMLSWVDRAETHPRAGPSVLQSLEETLTDWGLSQPDDIISSLEKWAKLALQAIMDHQSELEERDRGGPHAKTDLIGPYILKIYIFFFFSINLFIFCIFFLNHHHSVCGIHFFKIYIHIHAYIIP